MLHGNLELTNKREKEYIVYTCYETQHENSSRSIDALFHHGFVTGVLDFSEDNCG